MTDRESFSSEDLLREAKESLTGRDTSIPSDDPPEPPTSYRPTETARGPAPTPSASRRDPASAATRRRNQRTRDDPEREVGRSEPSPGAPPIRRSSPIGALARLVVLAVGGVIALGIFAQFAESVGEGPTEATVSLDSLSDGTCFEDPGTAPFSSVAPIDCANWHEYELIGRVTLPDGASPVDQTLDEAAFDNCLPLFETFVGRDYPTSIWWLNAIAPAEADWQAGDRVVSCVVFQYGPGNEVLRVTGSARGDGR